MGIQVKEIYVNLPVKDLNKSKEFFSILGFKINPRYSNEQGACMVINDTIYAMLMVEDQFKGFTNKEIPDTSSSSEAIFALAVDTKEEVDEIVNKALSAGGKPSNEPFDHGFMYGWSFQDLDGHLWEVFFMDPNAAPPQ